VPEPEPVPETRRPRRTGEHAQNQGEEDSAGQRALETRPAPGRTANSKPHRQQQHLR